MINFDFMRDNPDMLPMMIIGLEQQLQRNEDDLSRFELQYRSFDEPIPEMEVLQLRLQKQRISIGVAIDMLSAAKIDVFQEAHRNIGLQLRSHIFRLTEQESIEVSFPASWWQHLKKSLKDRFPRVFKKLKYKTLTRKYRAECFVHSPELAAALNSNYEMHAFPIIKQVKK